MASYAIIESNLVVNAVEAEADYADKQGWVLLPEGAGIGWSYIDGIWAQDYIVSDLSPDESAARVDEQWTVIRAERNRLLADSDWTQLPDASVDADAWAIYRQALKDITQQADPFNIIWPTEPE